MPTPDMVTAELTLTGWITTASNATSWSTNRLQARNCSWIMGGVTSRRQ